MVHYCGPKLGRHSALCYCRLMVARTRFCGIILAAGESSRMGRDKALLPFPGQSPSSDSSETFLSATIRLFMAHSDMVLVVAGKNKDLLAPIAGAHGASLVVNPSPERGQFSSLQTGLREALERGYYNAFITLVDRPPLRAETLSILKSAFQAAISATKWAVIPEYQGKHGHPILAGPEMIEAFLRAPDTGNAREVEHANQNTVEYFAVDDPFISLNVDTPEQYASLLSKSHSPTP